MKLLTVEIKNNMPMLGCQDGKGGDAVIHLKLFTPDSNWTWYAISANAIMKDGSEAGLGQVRDWDDVEDVKFFGLVKGFETELGYFVLSELEKVRGASGLPIERDMHFSNKTLKDVAPEKFM